MKAGVFGFVWGKLYKRDLLEQNKILMNTQYANFEDEDVCNEYKIVEANNPDCIFTPQEPDWDDFDF